MYPKLPQAWVSFDTIELGMSEAKINGLYFATIMTGNPKGKVFVPENFQFLRYTHITTIFWGQSDPT